MGDYTVAAGLSGENSYRNRPSPITYAILRRLAPFIVTKTRPIAAAIFDVEVTAPVRLIADVPRYLDALRLEFGTQFVGIIDPNICVPCLAIGIGQAVGAHRSRIVKLANMMTMPLRLTIQNSEAIAAVEEDDF